MKVPCIVYAVLIIFLPVAETLVPSTKPEEVILAQLSSLRKDDVAGVYKYASPENKQQTGDLKRFDEMIRVGQPLQVFDRTHAPGRYLVGFASSWGVKATISCKSRS